MAARAKAVSCDNTGMWKRFVKAWSAYRHFAAAKGLLQSLGLWGKVCIGGAAVVATLIAYFSRLPWWAQILVALCALAALLFIVTFLIVWRRVVIADRLPSQKAQGLAPFSKMQTMPALEVSGERARVAQGSEAGRDLILGDIHQHYAPKPELATQPQISLRILGVEVRCQPPRTIAKTGTLLDVDVTSLLTVVFSVLNSSACQTSLDSHLLEVTLPSGDMVDCRDITHLGGIGMEFGVPNPPGVQKLEMNAPLSQGNTIKRFARFSVTEIVKMEDPNPAGGFSNPLIFERLVFKAREDSGAYEKVGTLRLTISDSYGIQWRAEWVAHPMPPIQESAK
jgi:hypothetical protein